MFSLMLSSNTSQVVLTSSSGRVPDLGSAELCLKIACSLDQTGLQNDKAQMQKELRNVKNIMSCLFGRTRAKSRTRKSRKYWFVQDCILSCCSEWTKTPCSLSSKFIDSGSCTAYPYLFPFNMLLFSDVVGLSGLLI